MRQYTAILYHNIALLELSMIYEVYVDTSSCLDRGIKNEGKDWKDSVLWALGFVQEVTCWRLRRRYKSSWSTMQYMS